MRHKAKYHIFLVPCHKESNYTMINLFDAFLAAFQTGAWELLVKALSFGTVLFTAIPSMTLCISFCTGCHLNVLRQGMTHSLMARPRVLMSLRTQQVSGWRQGTILFAREPNEFQGPGKG